MVTPPETKKFIWVLDYLSLHETKIDNYSTESADRSNYFELQVYCTWLWKMITIFMKTMRKCIIFVFTVYCSLICIYASACLTLGDPNLTPILVVYLTHLHVLSLAALHLADDGLSHSFLLQMYPLQQLNYKHPLVQGL